MYRSLSQSCQVFLVLISLLLAGAAQAQSVQGSIVGTVTDKQGAIVSGAAITLTSLEEGTVRTTTSSDSGDFRFIDVKAAHYTVGVSSTGFNKYSATSVLLAARQQLRLDVALEVGSVQQEVQVSGDTISAIETETPSINAVLSATDVANLPVNTRAAPEAPAPLASSARCPASRPTTAASPSRAACLSRRRSPSTALLSSLPPATLLSGTPSRPPSPSPRSARMGPRITPSSVSRGR